MKLSRRFLVDIDCLFDTRIGWVQATQPELLEKLDFMAYRKRFTEVWAAVIGIPDWKVSYGKRDRRALMESQPTEFLAVLKNRMESSMMEIAMSSPAEAPALTINLWPYHDLNEAERQAFLDQFRSYFAPIKVDVICENTHRLTPGRLRAMWDAWFTYDWLAWIAINAKHFGATPIPSFVISRPSLLTDELTEETIGFINRDKVNPFKESTRFFAEYVTLDTLDTALFSLRHQPDDETQTPPS